MYYVFSAVQETRRIALGTVEYHRRYIVGKATPGHAASRTYRPSHQTEISALRRYRRYCHVGRLAGDVVAINWTGDVMEASTLALRLSDVPRGLAAVYRGDNLGANN